jgi:hypothetical protein
MCLGCQVHLQEGQDAWLRWLTLLSRIAPEVIDCRVMGRVKYMGQFQSLDSFLRIPPFWAKRSSSRGEKEGLNDLHGYIESCFRQGHCC